jgi:Cu(I)/Ag(I) efflux system membrane fusion protein
MKAGDSEKTSMTEHAAMSLPKPLQMQLHQAIAATDEIGSAIESADLGAIREAFARLGEQVAAVDAVQFTGDMKMQWQEFAMLLGNDAVEGSGIETLQHADDVFLVAKRHAERVTEMFGLKHAGHQVAAQDLVVADAFRAQLARILPAYLAIGSALASDDLDQVAGIVAGLRTEIGSIDARSLDGKAAERWQAELNSLSAIAARLSEAGDIAALRSSFALLSDELLTLQRTFGIANSDQLFELHCPMAFEGRGATWIQADSAVRNPYYGATMLKCADRVEKFAGE